jgi:hypothetical protein
MSPTEVRVFALARQTGVEATAILAAGRVLGGLDLKTPLGVVSVADRTLLERYFDDLVRTEAAASPEAPLTR